MVSAHYLAFDLGAESGRAIAGRAQSGVLWRQEVCRFANEPVRQAGARLLGRPAALARDPACARSVGAGGSTASALDAWGVDYALLGERGDLLENPYHYRDTRNEGIMDEVFERVGRDRSTG